MPSGASHHAGRNLGNTGAACKCASPAEVPAKAGINRQTLERKGLGGERAPHPDPPAHRDPRGEQPC